MMTNLRHTLQILGAVVALLLVASCERRPLYDDHGGNLYIEIDLDIDVDINVNSQETRVMPPQVFAVAFYEPASHEIYKTEYVAAEGGYVSINPGRYDILVYNFDTDYTSVRQLNNLFTIEAYTSPVTSDVSNRFSCVANFISSSKPASRGYEGQPLLYEPDHLYVGLIENFNIPASISDDDVLHVYVKPTTILESYTITIGPIINGEYLRLAEVSEVFITGMGSAKLVAERKISEGPATIWFPISPNEDFSQLTTTFKTFGRFPDADNRVYLLIHMIVNGNEYNREWDVTDQIASGSHAIVIEDTITINPTPGGGSAPTVNMWDEENMDIVLM